MTSEGSERVERREESKEHVDDDEFRQQMRELIGEVNEQINREEVEGGVESGATNKERVTEVEKESTDIGEDSGGDDEFRREMQELIAEVREISERDESEESEEFRMQMRELIDEVERELDGDERSADSAEDRLDEFEEDVLENFEKYGIDGDEVRERWRERFVEDVEEELEKDSASDELDESTKASDDAADSETTKTAESYSYSESGDGTVQVLKTEGGSKATESVDESEEHKAEIEPQSESDLSVENEKDRDVEEGNQKEDLESPKAEKQPEKQITQETESETSENSAQHELNRNSKERSPETREETEPIHQTSETVSESSKEKAEAAEWKEAQAESTEPHSAGAECEELAEEEVEDTGTESDLNESVDDEGEVIQDSDSKSMQEWTEDVESEELEDSEHLEEPDSAQGTLESYQEVLEENISPDAERLDEDEEVDEQVISDDKGLTGMPDSPYPTVYVDETGFFAETEEQRWKRKLIELYNKLPEETKQLYRELVKAMLESEEGLEKLLDTFSELREYEDFEEEHEDAIKYVKFRQKIRELALIGTQEETTVKELALELDVDQETVKKWLNDDYDSFPKIIQQVWNQEIERRWGSVLKAIANRDVPCDMGEIDEILKQFPELKRKRRFGWHYNEVKAWTEIMAAKRQGKIATLIIQGKERFKVDEVEELAKRFNLAVDKVVRWLRDESRPRLVDVLTEEKLGLWSNQNGTIQEPTIVQEAGTPEGWIQRELGDFVGLLNDKQIKRMHEVHAISSFVDPKYENSQHSAESDSTIDELSKNILRSKDDLDEAIEANPNIREFKDFAKNYHDALAYIRLRIMLESEATGALTQNEIAKILGTRQTRVSKWMLGQATPRIIRSIEGHPWSETDFAPAIESFSDVIRLIKTNLHIIDSKRFSERLLQSWLYHEFKRQDKNGKLAEHSNKKLSRIFGVSVRTIWCWRTSKTRPILDNLLSTQERARRKHEAGLQSKARELRIDPSLVYESFRGLKKSKDRTLQSIAESIRELIGRAEPSTRVYFAELRPYHQSGPNWLHAIADDIAAKEGKVEILLNELMIEAIGPDERLQIGVVGRTLYVWRHKTSQLNWANLYSDELFYFDLEYKRKLVKRTRSALGISGNVRLASVAEKICNHYSDGRLRRSPISDFLVVNIPYISGETLHFLIDTIGINLDSLPVKQIGTNRNDGQIVNPQFPRNIGQIIAQLYATVVSDGHIDNRYSVYYREKRHARLEIVKRVVCQLGDVAYKYLKDINGTGGLYFPPVIGRMLAKVGMPIGSKTNTNRGLPSFILENPKSYGRDYLREVIPEDGSFQFSRPCFSISRAAPLHIPDSSPMTTPEEIELIHSHGSPLTLKFPDNHRDAISITFRYLCDLSKTNRNANNLYQRILQTRNRLLDDEGRICKANSIDTKIRPSRVYLHKDTGKITVIWRLRTRTLQDAMRWAILAPPHDVHKRSLIERFISARQDIRDQVQGQLREEG